MRHEFDDDGNYKSVISYKKVSVDEYQANAKSNTEKALEDLRNYLATQDGRKKMSRVKDTDQELRVRRFVDNGRHIDYGLQHDVDSSDD